MRFKPCSNLREAPAKTPLFNFLRNFAGLRVASEDDYVPRITLLIGLFVVLVWAVHVLYSYTAAFAGRRMKGKTFYMILNRTSAVLF